MLGLCYGIFSCKDAALQVLMSVCLSVCPCVYGQPENLPFYILLQHTECSRMFQNMASQVQTTAAVLV